MVVAVDLITHFGLLRVARNAMCNHNMNQYVNSLTEQLPCLAIGL